MPNIKKNKLFKYKIKNLELFGYHGLYDEEITKGQSFLINVNFTTKYKIQKVNKDNISNVIDYTLIINKIETIFNLKRYNLLETLLNDLYDQLYRSFNFYNLNIKITKKISRSTNLKLDNINVEITDE